MTLSHSLGGNYTFVKEAFLYISIINNNNHYSLIILYYEVPTTRNVKLKTIDQIQNIEWNSIFYEDWNVLKIKSLKKDITTLQNIFMWPFFSLHMRELFIRPLPEKP